jgi:hypothetical protein
MSATSWPVVPAPDDRTINKCREVGGMKSSRGNLSTQGKPAPAPHPPRIPCDLTWDGTWATTVESRQLTA